MPGSQSRLASASAMPGNGGMSVRSSASPRCGTTARTTNDDDVSISITAEDGPDGLVLRKLKGTNRPGINRVVWDLQPEREQRLGNPDGLPEFIEFHEEIGATLIIAQLYAWIGDNDEAFRWLDTHDRVQTWNIRSHLTRLWYRKIYDDPRWQALLEQYQMTGEMLGSLDLDIRLPPGVEH